VKRLIEYYSIRPYQPATDPPPVCVCHLIGKNKKDANTNTDANHEPTNTATDPATETKKNE
jgi:hypothetical protein